jgi:hypothetical protein
LPSLHIYYTTSLVACQGVLRKNFIFFRTLVGEVCIAHNPLLFQPLGALVHIYIPQMRTPCGRKSLSGRSYSVTLRPHSSCCLPSFCIHYSILCGVCQEVFQTFFEKFFINSEWGLTHYLRSTPYSFTSCPLDTYIIPHFVGFVKGFLKSFSNFFGVGSFVRGHRPSHLPLTLIVYHRPHQKSIVKMYKF